MQSSLVSFKDLATGIRLDAEYYQPRYLEIARTLRSAKCIALRDVSKSIKSFGAYSLCNQMHLVDHGIPFLRCKDIQGGFVDFSEVLFIDEATNRLLSKSRVSPLTILLTMSGTVGNCAIADPTWEYPINSNQDIAKIEPFVIDPYYLAVFLNTKFGKSQTERLPIGSIQQHIFLWQLQDLLIYVPSTKFQNIIGELYRRAIEELHDSDQYYQQAEHKLLSELNLIDWRPQHELSFTRQFSETQMANRMDAEYYQPIYKHIDNAIKSSKQYAPLGDLVTIRKCVEPGSAAYKESGIPFLRVSNLTKFGINNDNQQYLDESLYQTLKTHQPTRGEILLSKDATPGIALYLKNVPGRMIPSGGILRLQVNDISAVHPEYLTLLLNSNIIQKQIERDAGGSIIDHWLVDQVKSTLIPILTSAEQKAIVATINTSFTKREQSVQLFNIAKQAVDMAIEIDEKKAWNWISAEVGNKCLAM